MIGVRVLVGDLITVFMGPALTNGDDYCGPGGLPYKTNML
jgi:hypothetical protein